MKSIAAQAIHQLRPLARNVVPSPVRRWLREQQRLLPQTRQNFYDRIFSTKLAFTNDEGFSNFDFVLSAAGKKPGVSAVLRIKNEEDKIYHSLGSIHAIFDEIVIVDNGSQDRTPEIVRSFKQKYDKDGRIRFYSYPFTLARCGPENSRSPENSVHSLCYYYNWSLSKCSMSYVCKWDGDMVLREEARETFRLFLNRLKGGRKKCWILYGQTVYRDLQFQYYLSKTEINGEVMIFPNGLNPRFYKTDLYEILRSEPVLDEEVLDAVVFYELKFTDADEFSHWSISEIPTERKKRELELFNLIKTNRISSAQFEKLPPDFLDAQIDSPVANSNGRILAS